MGGHGCQVSKVQFPKYERADEPRERGIASWSRRSWFLGRRFWNAPLIAVAELQTQFSRRVFWG